MTGPDGSWGRLDPETGAVDTVDPAADRKLPALASAVERGELIGYRAGRRAIVAAPDRFIKVVRPSRLEALVATHRTLAATGPPDLALPHLLASAEAGSLDLSPVPGRSLHQLLRSRPSESTVRRALDAIGAALASFHATPPGPDRPRRAPDEAARWVATVGRSEPGEAARLAEVADGLPPLAPTGLARSAVVHGDLHDKNVFVTTGGVGLIDLDSVALGCPEDDVANLGVHLELRALQVGAEPALGHDRARRLFTTYGRHRPLDEQRLDAVQRHTWFRLACLYRFRAASRPLVPELLRRATLDHR